MFNQTPSQTAMTPIVATPTPAEYPVVAASHDFNVGFFWGRDCYATADAGAPIPTVQEVMNFLTGELSQEALTAEAVTAPNYPDIPPTSYAERAGFAAGWLTALAEEIAKRQTVPCSQVIIH